MMPTRNRILFIHGGTVTDVESAKTARRTFGELGYVLDEISLDGDDPGAAWSDYMNQYNEQLAFFLGSNAWTFVFRQGNALLHTFTGIPLVLMLHDHPIYFRDKITSDADGMFVFCIDEPSADFVRTYYPASISATIVNHGSIPASATDDEPAFEDFKQRRNALLCPMNLMIHGLTMDAIWAKIQALPEPRRARARRLAEAVLYDFETPLHVISERMTAAGDSAGEQAFELNDLHLVLNFVKLWRRNRLVRSLIELPMLIGSEYVPADLAFDYPEKFKALDWEETLPLYRAYRFVLNLNPLLTGALHDRVTNALFSNAVVVTDPNAFVRRYFEDEVDMLFVDLGGATAGKVARYLDDPEAAFALTRNAARKRRRYDFWVSSYRNLVTEVEALWAARTAASTLPSRAP